MANIYWTISIYLQYVQEVVTFFIHEMGHYFLDTQYYELLGILHKLKYP